jgi:hypothetical protein
VVVLDQFRADTLTRFDAELGPNGFRRLLHDGASWTGHYGHYVTYTGPGHALILSGSYPYVNGIGANKFWNYDSKRSESVVFDPTATVFGMDKADPDMDMSPRNFIGSTLGDELHLATAGASKTVSLATKGRGAILLGGRLGKTFYLNDNTGEMTTSTYYYKDALPKWVSDWNAKKLADSFAGQLKMPAGSAKYYDEFAESSYANDYEFDFAKAAIEGENLGARGTTDILAISISATDLAGHAHGPFSPEVAKLVKDTDRQLGVFLDSVYAKYGRDEVVVVLTADHGATPVPEDLVKLGIDAGRIPKKAIKDAIEAALTKHFGEPVVKGAKPAAGAKASWLVALEDPHVFFNRALIADKKLDPAEVERVAGEAVARIKGIAGWLGRTQIRSGQVPPTSLAASVVRSYHAGRGGDLVLITAPFYFWGKYGEKPTGTTHGTYYRYDSEVPVMMVGRGIKPGRYGIREQVDIAATLSRYLGVNAPAGCEGEPAPIF